MPSRERGHFSFMSYIQGEGRSQGTLFPVVLDDLVPADHVCRVIDAFVDGLAMAELGFERAGCPIHDSFIVMSGSAQNYVCPPIRCLIACPEPVEGSHF